VLLAVATSPHSASDPTRVTLMLIWLGWVTWASTSLAGLLQVAGRRLGFLNDELRKNQRELEQRIDERTNDLKESQALVVQQEKQAAFGLLAAGIAHEVGNPLAGISSVIQLLNRRDVDDYTRERYQMVDDQLRRIQRTLRELIDFSRPATVERSQCDVQELVEAALNIAKYYKRRKNKQIVTRYAEGLPKINAVRDQLVQIFLNLILNAMDATAEGGTIEIASQQDGPRLRVSIRDDGHGIAEPDQARLFQPYFTTKETGTGLGLFVCKLIVERNEGQIELTETSDRGTTFSVLLPCGMTLPQ
jgi:signal transduction histidine kinase